MKRSIISKLLNKQSMSIRLNFSLAVLLLPLFLLFTACGQTDAERTADRLEEMRQATAPGLRYAVEGGYDVAAILTRPNLPDTCAEFISAKSDGMGNNIGWTVDARFEGDVYCFKGYAFFPEYNVCTFNGDTIVGVQFVTNGVNAFKPHFPEGSILNFYVLGLPGRGQQDAKVRAICGLPEPSVIPASPTNVVTPDSVHEAPVPSIK